MHKKPHLPEKQCKHCGLNFTWRKKWERSWAEVKYCSERCRREYKPANTPGDDTRALKSSECLNPRSAS